MGVLKQSYKFTLAICKLLCLTERYIKLCNHLHALACFTHAALSLSVASVILHILMPECTQSHTHVSTPFCTSFCLNKSTTILEISFEHCQTLHLQHCQSLMPKYF